jgi:asparagine synthase (glutamine-hydrolysing)
MCGISGIMYAHANQQISSISKSMNQQLAHRGPDASGHWVETNNKVALAHSRLSILGLGVDGNQPMSSRCGRFVVVFNGEIYNFQDIKKKLQLEGLNSGSDTEVLIEAISKIGITKTLDIVNGMFAFAIWDKKKLSMTLARDRMGEKPLYYSIQNNSLIFASELKSLTKASGFEFKICANALNLYFQHGYIPGPQSIYKKVNKLSPGHVIEFSQENLMHADITVHSKSFWKLRDSLDFTKRDFYKKNPHEAIKDLSSLLEKSVNNQMISDVPIGSFLSGGIDSSLITALMQKNSIDPINTFSIGFHDKSFNEAHYAKEVARFLGTNHVEHYVSADEAFGVIPDLGQIYDEPFADPSQIPTYLVSKIAKQNVTVVLSGDGGDELFAGYNRHVFLKMWESFEVFPYRARQLTGKLLNAGQKIKLFNILESLDFINFLPKNLNDKVSKISNRLIDIQDSHELIRSLSKIDNLHHPVINENLISENLEISHNFETYPGSLMEKMTYLDVMKYLPDDILVKVDRASMANSLETRAPFLDYKLVEFAFGLPESLRVRNRDSKWILKQALFKLVPRELIERPKMGFGVPVGTWINGPLKDWADSLLTEEKLNRDGLLNAELIRDRWLAHQNGSANWDSFLWSVLMFVLWMDSQ